MEYITAQYRIPWTDRIEERAQSIAIGMTVGSWTDLPDSRKPHLRPYLGEVGEITRDGDAGFFDIRYPVATVRNSISSLLTVIFGKLSLDGAIQLHELTLPESFTERFPGPRHGIKGLRRLLNVHERPFVMSIFKGENGRTLAEFEDALYEQLAGGVDIVKDDEIYMADDDAPLLARIQTAREACRVREALTGQRGYYIPTLSGTPQQILETAHQAVKAGANGFLIPAYTTGLDIVVDLRRQGITVPIILHPAFVGGQINTGTHGVHPSILLGQLPRLAGADMVLFPSPYGSVAMPREQSLAVADALREPSRVPAVLPGPSAGIHVGILPQLFRDFGPDIVINAGGAIHGHPQGTREGARILCEAASRFVEVCAT